MNRPSFLSFPMAQVEICMMNIKIVLSLQLKNISQQRQSWNASTVKFEYQVYVIRSDLWITERNNVANNYKYTQHQNPVNR